MLKNAKIIVIDPKFIVQWYRYRVTLCEGAVIVITPDSMLRDREC